MIKLTDEQITAIASTPAAVVGSYVHTFARAIEAEVLRINGWQSIETAPKDGTEVLLGEQGSGDYELARYHADMGKWLDRCSDELHFTPTHWRDPMPPAPPRATGCPDTMDDTARFAADEMPAILKEQAP